MGGTMGSLGIQANRTVFTGNENIKVAPVICYESVYGDYVTEYIRNGANFIFIITNDGWWDNTPGHKQHLSYARLRAIETRRCIARSANTGISCFIDETGAITQATNWWEKAVIEAKLKPNDQLTIFVRFGDILSKISVTLSALILAYYWFLRFFKR
jgi:apolipoprotein N-acyltransferase